MKFILASASPRRRELLKLIGLDPRVIVPSINEERKPAESLEKFIERITVSKGYSVYNEQYFDSVVLSADTIVLLEDTILGKPLDRNDAFNILRALSGNRHEVWTGISLLYRDKMLFDQTRTAVYFEEITDQEIDYYLDNETYSDKAGAYAIQGKASVFVKRIEGCYFNVMGLPLHLFMQMLKKIDIHLYSFPPGDNRIHNQI
ncbi:MAG: septum formation protein Maf [Candidatus Aminicenantes bacterium]|nr:septum formation protein Maf [Candidatus Aminicenantes bacterium]